MHVTLCHHQGFRFSDEPDNRRQIEIDDTSGSHATSHAGPMQLVATAVGGCSAIDLVDILTKGRQQIDSFEIEVDAERAESVPRVFTSIHIHFKLTGNLDVQTVRQTDELTFDKHCPVSKMLETSVTIDASFSVNAEKYGAGTAS